MKSNTNLNTYLFRFINQWIDTFQSKIGLFQRNFSISVFIFFLGFICGNLFGTFLIFFRTWLPWDGFIILLTILIIEWINYVYFYVTKLKPKPIDGDDTIYLLEKHKPSNFKDLIRLINFYKLGLLLGFFIDAFKVGS